MPATRWTRPSIALRCSAWPNVHSSGWKKPRRPSDVQPSENSCSSTKRRSSRQKSGVGADDDADLERHEARRPQLDVLADQAHRFEVRGDVARAARPSSTVVPDRIDRSTRTVRQLPVQA